MYLSEFLMNLSAIFTAAIARRPRLCYSIYKSMRNSKEAAVLDTIYLDNASTTFPKPACVPEAMLRYITGCGSNIARGDYSAAYSAEEMVFETRERICSLFGGEDSRCVVFTKNVTESLNVLLKGLLRPGDHVLVSSMEHNAVMRPLRQLEAQGVTFSRIPCCADGTLIAEAAEPLLRPSTRAVVMTHASNVCGTLLPIAEMGELCRQHGLLFLVDSAQTAGVFPIDMQAMHISALAFTGHKGLYGPQGTGGFVLRPELAAQWDREKNRALTPQQVTITSNRKVWWRCEKGHSYPAVIASRTNGSGCPYCTGKKVLAGFNDLATLEPKIAAEWHPTLNGALTSQMVSTGSRKKVWWECPLGHVWKAAVYPRTGAKKCGCPVCAGKTKAPRR